MDKNVALIEPRDKEIKETIGAKGQNQREGETVKEAPGQGSAAPKGKTFAQYIEELKIYAESIPGPNEGRIQELKDLIRSGKLITKEAIRETAEKLAQQFLGRSDS